MRNVVLYVGGFGLPDRSASALRALGNAAVLRDCGYEVVIAGKFAQIPRPGEQPLKVHGFNSHDIRQPLSNLSRVDYTRAPDNIHALVDHIGPDRILAIMAYNFPALGLHRLLRLGRDFGIPVINESTEWYGWEGFRPVTNMRRIIESRWRNTALVARAGNLICATNWLRNRHPKVNALVLPFALDPDWECWQVPADTSWSAQREAVRLVYSGSPGLGMHKDRLPLIVAALDRISSSGRAFCFGVVGMTAEDYLTTVPRHSGVLQRHAESIRFLGRMAHLKAVAILKSADLSIFVRERDRVSEVGFPTKYAEATVCGVPVLTNQTSDIADYLVDGDNGILLPNCERATLEQGLDRALGISREGYSKMKARMASRNPFAVGSWTDTMRAFMENLSLPS